MSFPTKVTPVIPLKSNDVYFDGGGLTVFTRGGKRCHLCWTGRFRSQNGRFRHILRLEVWRWVRSPITESQRQDEHQYHALLTSPKIFGSRCARGGVVHKCSSQTVEWWVPDQEKWCLYGWLLYFILSRRFRLHTCRDICERWGRSAFGFKLYASPFCVRERCDKDFFVQGYVYCLKEIRRLQN